MGVTKTEVYTTEQLQIANFCKALGHPARIAIVQRLLREEGCICKDFSKDIELSQPTISRHLEQLHAAGIITGTVRGTSRSFCLNPARRARVSSLLQGITGEFSSDGSCC